MAIEAAHTQGFAHAYPEAWLAGAACVVDYDNVMHLGCKKRPRGRNARRSLDIPRFSTALTQRGVGPRTVFRNWGFSDAYAALWQNNGFKTVAVHANVDDQVIAAATRFVAAGCSTLILVAGDGDYAEAVTDFRNRGVMVEVWSLYTKLSRELFRAADAVRSLDPLVRILRPRRRRKPNNNGAAAQHAS